MDLPASNSVTARTQASVLPPGWEQRLTPEGVPYYVDHATKTTHWKPPSINQAYSQIVANQQKAQAQTYVLFLDVFLIVLLCTYYYLTLTFCVI